MMNNSFKSVPCRNAAYFQKIDENDCSAAANVIDYHIKNREIPNKYNVRNPYEVERQQIVKKRRIEDSCFENPALNLDVPEKTHNPFEVKRRKIIHKQRNCFVNAGLNIRKTENDIVINPYEISRLKDIGNIRNGIENPALESPTPFAIQLPFQPTVGCRINFENFLIEKPIKQQSNEIDTMPQAFYPGSDRKKSWEPSLATVDEEQLDIGEKLDSYQLELENSINEAISRKLRSVTAVITQSTSKRSTNETSINDVPKVDYTNDNLESFSNKKIEREPDNRFRRSIRRFIKTKPEQNLSSSPPKEKKKNNTALGFLRRSIRSKRKKIVI